MNLARRLVLIAVACAVVWAGKTYYRSASADDLGWMLAPTARLVSLSTGTHFVRQGIGWVDRDVGFVIAPVCAGVNFALAAFLALTAGGLAAVRSWRGAAAWLALVTGLAYAGTLLVNTVRIAIAIRMHVADLGGFDRRELHRWEGILVYLGGLCALYALAGAIARRWNRAVAAG